jgi:hypothetical protein
MKASWLAREQWTQALHAYFNAAGIADDRKKFSDYA